MPNWCQSIIKFYSEDAEQVEAMYKKFQEIIEGKPTAENDFKHGWMGDFANVFFSEHGHEKTNCRGWVDGVEDLCKFENYTVFNMYTETAWGPKIGMWYEITKRFYPKVKIAYVAEEPGCGLYNVWDETEGQLFFPEAMYVEGCLPDKDGHCEYIDDHYEFGDLQDVMEFLDRKLPFKYAHADSEEALTEEVQSKLEEFGKQVECDEDVFFYVARFLEVHPSEYEVFDE